MCACVCVPRESAADAPIAGITAHQCNRLFPQSHPTPGTPLHPHQQLNSNHHTISKMASSLACSQRLSAQPSTSSRCVQTPQLRPAVARRSLSVRAAKLPEGVTLPPRIPVSPESKFGFVKGAEKLNSRAAMLGFFGILIVEAIANKGIFEMVGFEVGKGLGFEF